MGELQESSAVWRPPVLMQCWQRQRPTEGGEGQQVGSQHTKGNRETKWSGGRCAWVCVRVCGDVKEMGQRVGVWGVGVSEQGAGKPVCGSTEMQSERGFQVHSRQR